MPLRKCFVLLFLLAGCIGIAVSGCRRLPEVPPPIAPTDVSFTEEPITIDGKLDDKAWEEAVVIDNFSMPWLGKGNKPASAATRAKILWDRENLYVCADMDDADLYASITEHDGNTWENDVFEVFLKPSSVKPAYYEFHVTPANTQFDLFLPRRGHVARFKKIGDFGLESAVSLRGTLGNWSDKDNGWSVELRIPWESLMRTGGRPAVGDTWMFALCRYDFDIDREQPELSTCAPLTRLNFHAHEDFATLRFVGASLSTSVSSSTSVRPYGIPALVPVTTSKVVGSPDPPLPYTVQRMHPLAKISGPITVAHQPKSDLLLYVTEPWSYQPSSVMRMRDDPSAFEPETLLKADGSVHYSIVFHPQFAGNGYVYIGSNGPVKADAPASDSTLANGKQNDKTKRQIEPEKPRKMTRITRYRIDREPPYTFHADSAEVVIEWDSDGHNGGDMAFGPDGMMYVTSGDGTSDSDADLAGQDLTRLRSKLLRIDVDHPDETTPGDGRAYSVPIDNPFVGTENVRPETWAYGLRNPWRLTIDQMTGQIWVANNGQDLWEQIYLIKRGANYGWSVVEGSHPFALERTVGPDPISKPVAEHSHADARSLTGGIVYTGEQLPDLKGAYLYGDYSTGRIWGMRHDGDTVTWHELIADTTLQITSFGTDSRGEIMITDHRPGLEGGFYRLIPTPPVTTTPPPFPQTLSASGLFASVASHTMAPGVIPYAVNSPLWSDGTHKARFFSLPPTMRVNGLDVPATIDVTSSKGWIFPEGTVLVKSFAIDSEEGNPATRKWIETRFMMKESGEWAGYSYEWNDGQTDAVLVDSTGKDRDFEIRTADLANHANGIRTQSWHYPSRTECMICHSRATNFVLGLCTVQLNRDFDYKAVLGQGHANDNQLRTLEHLGVLRVNWWSDAYGWLLDQARGKNIDEKDVHAWASGQTTSLDADAGSFGNRRSTMLAKSPAHTNHLVDPYDASQDLGARARSYMQSNCSSCHIFAGGGNAAIDLEFLTAFGTTPIEKTNAIDKQPMHHTFGLPNAKIIAAGDPERSVLLCRVARRGPGQMPQLATSIVDQRAVELLREWIESIPPPAEELSQNQSNPPR